MKTKRLIHHEHEKHVHENTKKSCNKDEIVCPTCKGVGAEEKDHIYHPFGYIIAAKSCGGCFGKRKVKI